MFRKRMSVLIYSLFLSVPLSWAQMITLEQAIEEACANNYVLKSAEENSRSVNAAFWEAVSPSNPELFREWEGIPWASRSLYDWGERKTGVVQHFEFPLTYWYRGRQADRQSKAAEAAMIEKKNRIISEVKKRFYKVLLNEEKRELFQKIHDLSRDNFRMARIRVLSGEASPYDTLKIKVDLAEAANDLHDAEKQYAVSQSEFAEILGRPIYQPVLPAGELTYERVAIPADSLEEITRIHHPGLMRNRMEYQSHQAKLTQAWTEMLPGFSLKYFKFELQGIPGSRRQGAEIGVSLPLWFLLRDQGRIRTASHAKRAAFNAVQSGEQAVLLQLKRNVAALETAMDRAANYHYNTLKEVEELVRIASRSYEAGEMGYLELADAMRTMNRVRAGYFESLYTVKAAQADLEESVGTELFY